MRHLKITKIAAALLLAVTIAEADNMTGKYTSQNIFDTQWDFTAGTLTISGLQAPYKEDGTNPNPGVGDYYQFFLSPTSGYGLGLYNSSDVLVDTIQTFGTILFINNDILFYNGADSYGTALTLGTYPYGPASHTFTGLTQNPTLSQITAFVTPDFLHKGGIDTALGSYALSDLGTVVSPSFQGGTLRVNVTGTTVSQNFTISAAGGTIDQNSNTVTLSGVISDAVNGTPGALTISNGGVGGSVTLSGVNTYTGATTVNLGASLMLTGTGSIALSSGVVANGALDISGVTTGASIKTLSGNGTVTLGSKTLTLSNANSTFSGGISGTGGVNLTGGLETFSGNNNYTGGTNVTGGTLRLGSITALPSTGNVANGGAFMLPNSNVGGTTINYAQSFTISGSGSGGGALFLGSADTSSSMSLAGTITLTSDSTIRTQGNGASTQTISGVIAGASTRTLTVNTDNLSQANLTGSQVATINRLAKIGGGTLSVAQGAGITGGTVSVIAGAFRDNGSVIANLDVSAGALLGGSGSITGRVTVGGTLAPGNSPGKLTVVAGDTNMSTGSNFVAELGGTTAGNGNGFHDQYNLQAGTLTIAAGVTLNVKSWVAADGVTTFQPARGNVFTILKASNGINGSFTDLTNADYSNWMIFDNFSNTAHQFGDLYGTSLTGAQSFAAYGTNNNRAQIGLGLWNAAITASPSSTALHPAAFLDGNRNSGQAAIALLTSTSLDATLDAFSPESYLSITDYAMTVMRSVSDSIFGRMSAVKSGKWSFGVAINNAYKQFNGASSDSLGYRVNGDTPLASLSYEFTDVANIGLFSGYNSGTTKSSTVRSEFTGNITGLHGSVRLGQKYPVTLRGMMVASDLDADTTRYTPMATSGDAMAVGFTGVSSARNQAVRSYLGSLSASLDLACSSKVVVSPLLGFVASHSQADAVTETGTGANLRVNAMDSTSTRGSLGLSAKYAPTPKVLLALSGGLEREFSGRNNSATAQFTDGTGATPFTVMAAQSHANFANIGLSAAYRFTPRAALNVSLQQWASRDSGTDRRLNASVNVDF